MLAVVEGRRPRPLRIFPQTSTLTRLAFAHSGQWCYLCSSRTRCCATLQCRIRTAEELCCPISCSRCRRGLSDVGRHQSRALSCRGAAAALLTSTPQGPPGPHRAARLSFPSRPQAIVRAGRSRFGALQKPRKAPEASKASAGTSGGLLSQQSEPSINTTQ